MKVKPGPIACPAQMKEEHRDLYWPPSCGKILQRPGLRTDRSFWWWRWSGGGGDSVDKFTGMSPAHVTQPNTVTQYCPFTLFSLIHLKVLFILLITENLYPLTYVSPLPPAQPLSTTILFSVHEKLIFFSFF